MHYVWQQVYDNTRNREVKNSRENTDEIMGMKHPKFMEKHQLKHLGSSTNSK